MFTIDPDKEARRRSGGKVRPLDPGGRIVGRYPVLQSFDVEKELDSGLSVQHIKLVSCFTVTDTLLLSHSLTPGLFP